MAKRSISIIKKAKAGSVFSEILSICLHESSMSTLNLRKQTVQRAALLSKGYDEGSASIRRFHGTV